MDIPALADCNPGLDPLEYNVVVAPAKMPERVGSIFIPNDTQDRMGDAIQIGRIVAVSPLAFTYEAWPEGSHPPQPGDVVWIVKFGGSLFIGADEREYRFVKDKDVIAVIGM